MHLIKTKYTLIIFLFLNGIIILPTSLQATDTSPLDSLKQRLRHLKIPYEIQEDWVEELELYEDRQNSPIFKELLADVNKQLEAYLLDKENYEKPKKPKKKSFKQQLGKIGKSLSKKVNQGIKSTEIAAWLTLANTAENEGDYNEAIRLYKKVVNAFENQENWKKWVEYQEKIAHILATKKNDFAGALKILPSVKEKMRELGDGKGMRRIDTKIKNLRKNLDISVVKEAPPVILPPTVSPKPPVVTTTSKPQPPITPDVVDIAKEIKKQEEEYAKQQAALEARKKAEAEAAAKLKEAESAGRNQKEIERLRREQRNLEKARLKDEKEAKKLKDDLTEQKLILAEKEAEINKQALAQRNLYGGLAILGVLFFSTFLLYRSKQKDHKKLAVAYDELAEAQEELKKAEQKIKGLLDQQVSGAVAAELLAENPTGTTKHERRFVCIMFLDIRNFTPFVESKTPEEIIEYQNNVLGFMMEKVIEHGGIVNTVLGDGFMATFGAPISSGNDCLQAYKAAVEILQMVREKSRTGQIPATKIGIGMHAGNVVAGNVGTKTRKQYLVTGNTVIIAARLEQLNKEYGSSLVISREVVERLPKAMNLPKVFDEVMVKGRSKPVEIAKYG